MTTPGDAALPSTSIQTIAIIGAGAAGRGFAAGCLRSGLHVVLEDVMPANLRRAQADLPADRGQLDLASTVEDAVRSADLAIDFVPDELESKLEIFSMIDRMAPPRTIICSPSESLSITDLASCVYRPDRCIFVSGLTSAGLSAGAAAIRLVYPPAASAPTLTAVQQLFLRLGLDAQLVADSVAPMLTATGSRLSNNT